MGSRGLRRKQLDRRAQRVFEEAMEKPDKTATPKAEKSPTRAAVRALAEAATRRAEIDARAKALPKEHGGRRGAEPVRYGDWEVKGIASDF